MAETPSNEKPHKQLVQISTWHPCLKFIEEDPNDRQRVNSKRAIRSHVARGRHRKLRERQRIIFELGSQVAENNRNVQVDFPLRAALAYKDHLIPYTFFTNSGPVLELPHTSRPFYNSISKELYNPAVFPRQSVWMPNATVPEVFKVKGPILDLEVVHWISNTPQCYQYRTETIKWVHERLANRVVAIQDETLGAVMTLAMWESYRVKVAYTDLMIHMSAVEQLVQQRGGLDAIAPDLAFKLALFDHIIAAMTLFEPRFSPRSQAVLFPSASTTHCFYDSPIYGSLPFDSFVNNTNADARIASLLDQVRERTEEIGTTPVQARTPRKPGFSVTDNPSNPIHQILILTSRIFLKALQSPSPDLIFSSPSLNSRLQIINQNLNSTRSSEFVSLALPPLPITTYYVSTVRNDPFQWTIYPGICLWVVLVGAACSVNRRERGYYMMFLARVGIYQGGREFDESVRRWCHLFGRVGVGSEVETVSVDE